MAARTIQVETELPTGAECVWQAMKHPASFLYVTRGLVGFPALAGRTDPIRAGEAGRGWVLAFNLVPAYRHTIEVIDVDDQTRSIRTHEYGGTLRRWDHTLHVEPIGETRCRYRDTVVIDAGPITRLVCLVAIGIYRYRQRRWHRLVRKHLLPTGPRYGRSFARTAGRIPAAQKQRTTPEDQATPSPTG
jgi:hypothetical protein